MLNRLRGNWSLLMLIGPQLKMSASRMEASHIYYYYIYFYFQTNFQNFDNSHSTQKYCQIIKKKIVEKSNHLSIILGHLAVIRSAEEQNMYTNEMVEKNVDTAWIGVNDLVTH